MTSLAHSENNIVHFPTCPTVDLKRSNRDLATAISTVLNHPNCPAGLYNAMVDELGELQGSWMNDHFNGPEFLTVLLDNYGEYGNAPEPDEDEQEAA